MIKFTINIRIIYYIQSMERYNVVFNEEKQEGVYAISVVESPAMESMFLALSKDSKPSLNIELKESEEGKKENILLGVALIPDKPVYRNQGGQEFEIIFSKDTIKKAAHNFLKMGYQHNSSVEHEESIKGVSIVESWIVKDANNDAANAYGLNKDDIVEGAWIVKMKCDNKDIYDKAISGEIKGFSIDGLFDLEKVNLKTDVKMSEELKEKSSVLEEIKVLLGLKEKDSKVEKIELATAILADEKGTIEYEGEELAEGVNVWILNGEDRSALPVGDYMLEDGRMLVVAEEGKVAEVKAAVEEEVEMAESFDLEEFKNILAQLKTNVDQSLATQKEELTKEFETKLSEQKKEFETQLSKTPAAKPLKSAPTQHVKGESITQFLNKRK